MSIVRRTWPRVEEFWFDEPLPENGVDVAWLYQRPADSAIAAPTVKHTLVVDLTLPEEQLFANIDSDTRYEIRRAQNKDALDFHPPNVPDAQAVEAFHDFFARFAADKGLPAASLEYLQAMTTAGMLRLSGMSQGGEMLVWHSHLVLRGRARLLHSASLFRGQDGQRRNMIGRANRLLHWLDMKAFRDESVRLYDFGGWYAGEADEERLRINRFKEGFGGRPHQEIEGVLPLTLLGKLYLWARKRRS